MSNINKILITVVVCVLILSVAAVSIVKTVTNGNNTTDPTQTATDVSVQPSGESTTAYTGGTTSTFPSQATVPSGDASQTTASTAANAPSSSEDLSQAILGKWTDSLGMMGYEFFNDGMVDVTVFDLKQLIGLDLAGSGKVPYTLEGDILTIKFSAYTGTAKWQFRVSVEGNELQMYNLEEHKTSVYTRAS